MPKPTRDVFEEWLKLMQEHGVQEERRNCAVALHDDIWTAQKIALARFDSSDPMVVLAVYDRYLGLLSDKTVKVR